MPTERNNVWVVDDEASSRRYLSTFLGARGFGVQSIESGEQVLRRLATSGEYPSLLIVDIHVPAFGGLELLAELSKQGWRIPSIILSGVQQVSTAVKAMQMGASDYLLKPFEESDLETAIKKAIKAHGSVVDPSPEVFATSNKKMHRVRDICNHIAETDVPVLILGESGVGKEVVAHYIHARSGRPDPFVKVNCAALPTDLLESELFGHERGAFTGAQREKPGKFELAGQGTILLDEIGDMSPLLQAKLLHVLQDGEYSRLGGTSTFTSKARTIAATNKQLHTLVRNGEFREDLFFRLNVVTLEIPPLRERREDIAPLCSHFLKTYRDRYKSSVKEVPPELMTALIRYPWPGNIRQLENVIKRFLIFPEVQLAISELERSAAMPLQSSHSRELSLKELSAGAAEKAEKELILRTLEEVNWNRKQAAKRLKICYKSLLTKLHRWQNVPAESGIPAEAAFTAMTGVGH